MLKRYDRVATIIAVVGLSAAVAGCGGGSDPSPTKAEFIRQADKICEETNSAQYAAIVKATKEAKGKSLAPAEKRKQVIAGGMVPIEQEAKELAALGAPSGDEKVVAEIVEGIGHGARAVQKVGTIASVGPAFRPVNEKAAKYGLEDCAESP